MTVSQKRAIWYSERKKQLERQEALLKEKGKLEDFWNSKYKTMTNYIKFGMR